MENERGSNRERKNLDVENKNMEYENHLLIFFFFHQGKFEKK